MAPTVLLIPSPLLGPASWTPTAQAMQRRGRRTRTPDLRCVAAAAAPYWPAAIREIVRSAGEDEVLLVAHSNAGLLVPAVRSALGTQVRGAVFVDAALPGAGYAAHRDFLDALAGGDGLLPPWTSWWDDAAVAELFPDAGVRARVEAEQTRMPRAYWDHVPPAPEGWDETRCAYVWFAEPYDAGAVQVAERGWPTRHLPGGHLHMVVDPQAVAEVVLELAGD